MLLQESPQKGLSHPFLHFKTQATNINIYQQESLICIHWNSQARHEEIIQGYQVAADLCQKFRVSKWLNDVRNIPYLNIEDQNWICRHIMPRLRQNNISKLARVVLDEPLAILISYNMCDQVASSPELADKLNCETFTDVENALWWLQE